MIVLVDDEEDLREPVAAYLADQGLAVEEAEGGAALDDLINRRGPPKLVILDVNMPGEDGFAIARRLRRDFGDGIGIIMLTSRRDLVDRVVGLELGADDYVTKPFEPRELAARIGAVTRRLGAAAQPESSQEDVRAPSADDGVFWVPTNRGLVRVDIESIEWIEAARDYAMLHTAQRSFMIRATMAELECRLEAGDMVRVHRSAIVRPSAVSALREAGRHCDLVLKSGRLVRVGPIYVREIRGRFKGLIAPAE